MFRKILGYQFEKIQRHKITSTDILGLHHILRLAGK